jgi:hypothetical protein
VTWVCLISSMAALSFSSWLPATHTSIAYRLAKPKNMLTMKIEAAPYGRGFFVIVIMLVVPVSSDV